jgi:uncharacterized protein (DUF111 family)
MILSSLIDVGVPENYLCKELTKLSIPGFSMSIEKQKRSGIECSHLILSWDGHDEHIHAHENNDHGHEHSHGHDHEPTSIIIMNTNTTMPMKINILTQNSRANAISKRPQILAIIEKAGYNEKVFASCKKILGAYFRG